MVRVGLQLGYDDLELLNPLGVCRGNKKIGGFYGAIMNFPAEMRFKHSYMSPLCIVEEKLLTRCDPVRVVSGADPATGEVIPEDVASMGAQLRALEKGVKKLVSSAATSLLTCRHCSGRHRHCSRPRRHLPCRLCPRRACRPAPISRATIIAPTL